MKNNVFCIERKKLGLTQEQLAKKLNTSRSNVANWENDQNMPSVDLLFKCSEIFNCDVAYLAGYEFDKNIPEPEYPEDDFFSFDHSKDELAILFDKHKDILTESDRTLIKTIIEQRKKEIDKELDGE